MTQQEEQLLNGLVDRVNATSLQSKDADAERLLQARLGGNPDALYVLCQTVLVQQFAMEKSQADLQTARAEAEQLKAAKPAESHGSFLGNLFGMGKAEEPAHPVPAPSISTPTGYTGGGSQYAPVSNAPAVPPEYGRGYGPGYASSYAPGYGPGSGYPPPPQAGYGAPPMMGGGMFGGGGGFLQGAMQTAAGVVAGEMAFRALEGVFGGGHHGWGFGGGSGNEVVNNYYGDDASSQDNGGFGDRLAQADGYSGGVSQDIEDRRGESQGFFGGGDPDGGDTSAFTDDSSSSFDDGGADDSGFDGGGGDDNSF